MPRRVNFWWLVGGLRIPPTVASSQKSGIPERKEDNTIIQKSKTAKLYFPYWVYGAETLSPISAHDPTSIVG
jgi:hypothetical protein